RRHTRSKRDWSSDVCSSDLLGTVVGLMVGGMLVGLVLSLIMIFRRKPSGPMTLIYSAAEGVFLGAITGIFEHLWSGIALQAILEIGRASCRERGQRRKPAGR